jgi:hypothetical protein
VGKKKRVQRMVTTMEQVRSVLDEIAAKEGGVLRPEAVVEEARAADHPLHDRFDWNDTTAAHAHRVEQARNLIQTVKYVSRTETHVVKTVYYVRDPQAAPGEQGYKSLPQIMSSDGSAASLLHQEFRRALVILERARDLSLALGVESSVDDMVSRLRQLSDEIQLRRVA